MADSQVKTANICNITSGTTLYANAGGSGTYIADNSISVHMVSGPAASGIYILSLPEISVIGDKYTISFIPICAANTTLLIELAGVQKSITFTSGVRKSVTVEARAANRNLAFYGGDGVEKTVIIKDIQIERGETATVYRPYSATGWVHSLRKLTTATEAVENPLYSDGTAITAYTLKGNTVQNGTPTPSNPVEVNGVGVRTENLFDGTLLVGFYEPDINTLFTDNPNYRSFRIQGLPAGQYTISWNIPVNLVRVYYDGVLYSNAGESLTSYTVTSSDGDIAFSFRDATAPTTPWSNSNTVMLNTGSTAKPYEPPGYKIPISSGGVTTNIYLGSTQTTRKIKKLVLDGTENWQGSDTSPTKNLTLEGYAKISGISCVSTHYKPANNVVSGDPIPYDSCCLYIGASNVVYLKGNESDTYPKTITDFKAYLAQQYANGTPVTVWYVLATPETAVVNEPLMKIGTYADTLSNATAIPTTEGANSITVDTTVQPSEFTATWTGWHDASVKEKSENLAPEIRSANGWVIGYLNVTNGEYIAQNYNGEWLSPSIPLTSGETITISAMSISYPSMSVYYWNGSTFIYGESATDYSGSSFTAPPNTTHIRFALRAGSDNKTEEAVISSGFWVMLNTGSTALPYEPYWK